MVKLTCLGFSTIFMALFTCVFAFSTNFPTSTFDESFFRLFGNDHFTFLDQQGKSVQIALDATTGSGFISQHPFYHAYFSASIKLPAGYAAGVVVTFYTSNNQIYPNSHDEIDFELLGNIKGKNWTVQTNIYGNGSVSTGREERYSLWFDPTEDFHNYGILWIQNWVIFYVDGVPIREFKRVDIAKGTGDDHVFPSKPMSLYATIWDGSSWATDGGKHKINFKYAPFVAKFSDFVLHGCPDDPTQKPSKCVHGTDLDQTFHGLSTNERNMMKNFRNKYMIYSYCNDHKRYPTPLPECLIGPIEARKP